MPQKLIQFRLDESDPVDACTLRALEECHGSEHKVAKRLVQVYALAATTNPAVNLLAAQQQASTTPPPAETCFGASVSTVPTHTAERLDPIEVNYGEL
ncbi:MAG: hypothetical protein AAF959_18710 [Cyanobacteria bacterium P01_D01_bin.56]